MKTVSETAASVAVAALLVLFVLGGVAAGQGQVDSSSLDLATVLERAGRYVADYEGQLGTVIGEEEYVQNAAWLGGNTPPTVVKRERRRLASDFLLLQVRARW